VKDKTAVTAMDESEDESDDSDAGACGGGGAAVDYMGERHIGLHCLYRGGRAAVVSVMKDKPAACGTDFRVACAGGGCGDARAPCVKHKPKQKYVLALPHTTDVGRTQDGKLLHSAMIIIIRDKVRYCYFHDEKTMMKAVPFLAGAIVLTGEDLDKARAILKRSREKMHSKQRMALPAEGVKRGGEVEAAPSKMVKGGSTSESASESD
jgi:hypothetical protein